MKRLFFTTCLTLLSLNAFAADPITLAVNEGVSYHSTVLEIRDKYKDLTTLLSKALNREVKIVPVDYYDKLRKGLDEQKYDLAMVHPAHVSLASLESGKYRLLALTKGYTDYRAHFLVPGNSAIKSLADLKGKRIVTPDQDSITAVIARATMRDAGIKGENSEIKTVKFQDAVPYFLSNGYADVGVVGSAAVAREWQAKGGKVFYESKPVPIKHIIASSRLSGEEVDKIRTALVGLENNEPGQKILKQIGQKGFTPSDEKQLAGFGRWLTGA